jgi:hypothetical protein
MADKPGGPMGVYITSPPKGKASPWVGIWGYIRFIVYGLGFFAACSALAWLWGWLV